MKMGDAAKYKKEPKTCINRYLVVFHVFKLVQEEFLNEGMPNLMWQIQMIISCCLK